MANDATFADQQQFFESFVKELADYVMVLDGGMTEIDPKTPRNEAIDKLSESYAIRQKDKVEFFQPVKMTLEYIGKLAEMAGWNDDLAQYWNKTGRMQVYEVFLRRLEIKRATWK